MKKLLIITIVLLIHSFPSYSNTILNKGLFCTNVINNKDGWAFGFFSPNKIDMWQIDQLNLNKTQLTNREDLSKNSSYEFTEDKLILYYVKDKYDVHNKPMYIDRYDLSMKWFTKSYQCELITNKSNFEKFIKNFRKNRLNKRKF